MFLQENNISAFLHLLVSCLIPCDTCISKIVTTVSKPFLCSSAIKCIHTNIVIFIKYNVINYSAYFLLYIFYFSFLLCLEYSFITVTQYLSIGGSVIEMFMAIHSVMYWFIWPSFMFHKYEPYLNLGDIWGTPAQSQSRRDAMLDLWQQW